MDSTSIKFHRHGELSKKEALKMQIKHYCLRAVVWSYAWKAVIKSELKIQIF
jgi:hypothetical protein